MAKFIELTPRETGEAILFNVDVIVNVISSDDGGCELLCNVVLPKSSKGCNLSCMQVTESYNLVRKLLIP